MHPGPAAEWPRGASRNAAEDIKAIGGGPIKRRSYTLDVLSLARSLFMEISGPRADISPIGNAVPPSARLHRLANRNAIRQERRGLIFA